MSRRLQGPQPRHGGVVALKVLKESDSPNPQYLRRFQQEAARPPGSPTPGKSFPSSTPARPTASRNIAMSAVEGLTLDRALSTNRLTLRNSLEALSRSPSPSTTRTSGHRSPRPQAGEHLLWMPPNRPTHRFGLAKMDHLKKPPRRAAGRSGRRWYIVSGAGDRRLKGTDPR